ncbi:glutenin, high molecular weight subunit DX5-like [Hyalella azteca]|uniref:Glutenin, high molecular weight subunit DX5-like n=1 Tax=Hyalella azteca TaxID=294128 RepID=A0A8B7NY32_HYAAZ|nr:glutenin, high molecular weight subunit DX5-like [Hyalella azteca]
MQVLVILFPLVAVLASARPQQSSGYDYSAPQAGGVTDVFESQRQPATSTRQRPNAFQQQRPSLEIGFQPGLASGLGSQEFVRNPGTTFDSSAESQIGLRKPGPGGSFVPDLPGRGQPQQAISGSTGPFENVNVVPNQFQVGLSSGEIGFGSREFTQANVRGQSGVGLSSRERITPTQGLSSGSFTGTQSLQTPAEQVRGFSNQQQRRPGSQEVFIGQQQRGQFDVGTGLTSQPGQAGASQTVGFDGPIQQPGQASALTGIAGPVQDQFGRQTPGVFQQGGHNQQVAGVRGGQPDIETHAQYNFKWDVNDPESGNFYGHQEERDGALTRGRYYVTLPDTRVMTVDYYADETGYHPTITFEGEAQQFIPTRQAATQVQGINAGGPISTGSRRPSPAQASQEVGLHGSSLELPGSVQGVGIPAAGSVSGQTFGNRRQEGQELGVQPQQGQTFVGQPQQAQLFGGQPQQGQNFIGQPQQAQLLGGQPQQGQPIGGLPQQAQLFGGQPQQGQLFGGQPQQGQLFGGQPQQGQTIGGQPQEAQLFGGQPQQGQAFRGQIEQGQTFGGQPQQGQTFGRQPQQGLTIPVQQPQIPLTQTSSAPSFGSEQQLGALPGSRIPGFNSAERVQQVGFPGLQIAQRGQAPAIQQQTRLYQTPLQGTPQEGAQQSVGVGAPRETFQAPAPTATIGQNLRASGEFLGSQERGFIQQPGQGLGQNPVQGIGQQPGQGFIEQPGQGFIEQPGQGFTQQPGQGLGQQTNQGFGQQPNQGFGQQPNQGIGQLPSQGSGEQQNQIFPNQGFISSSEQSGLKGFVPQSPVTRIPSQTPQRPVIQRPTQLYGTPQA